MSIRDTPLTSLTRLFLFNFIHKGKIGMRKFNTNLILHFYVQDGLFQTFFQGFSKAFDGSFYVREKGRLQ